MPVHFIWLIELWEGEIMRRADQIERGELNTHTPYRPQPRKAYRYGYAWASVQPRGQRHPIMIKRWA